MNDLIVCAAMKMSDGLIVPGVRHYSPEMRSLLYRIYGSGYHRQVVAQGFINTRGEFLERDRACEIARANNQIRNKTGPADELFSEDLY